MLLGSEMKFVRRKEFVKLKDSRSHYFGFRDLNSRKIVSFLRKIEEYKEPILTIIVEVIIKIISKFLLGTVFRTRVDVATRR